MAESPFEIIAGPATVYIAPTGTAFPDVNALPGAAWVNLGDTEGGVAVIAGQTVKELTVDQSMLPVKVIRTAASMRVEFSLAEITLENFAYALGLSVVDVAPGVGTIGTRSVTLSASGSLARRALLVRGPSPYGDWTAQFELPNVGQTGEINLRYVKDDKAVIATVWMVMEDPDNANQFGVVRAQDAAAT